MIDNRYCSGNWRLLFRWWSAIVVLAAIGDSFFSHYRWLLFWRWLVIIGWKLRSSTQTNSKNWSPGYFVNTFCVCEKTDKIWFVANDWPNIMHNARWSAFAGPNEAFASCSNYVTHSLTHSIRSCGQGLSRVSRYTQSVFNKKNQRINLSFAGPNEAFASCSHYVTHSLTHSICSCGEGLSRVSRYTQSVFNKKKSKN